MDHIVISPSVKGAVGGDMFDTRVPASLPCNQPQVPPRPWNFQAISAITLGVLATVTSIVIAIFAGWERGGFLIEQVAGIAISVLAVLFVHLLPTLCRSVTRVARLIAAGLWVISLVVVLYGQMTVFLLAQQHAGDYRANTLSIDVAPSVSAHPPARSLTAIAQDRAGSQRLLASLNSQRCTDGCAILQRRRIALSVTLDALATEADEVKRWELSVDRQNEQADRVTRLRDSLRGDPITTRLASWTGLEVWKFNQLLALVYAAVLEGMACLCWYVGLLARRPIESETVIKVGAPEVASRRPIIAAVMHPSDDDSACDDSASKPDTDTEFDSQLIRLVHDVAQGVLRPTVDGIRSYYHCAQATAVTLRREYVALQRTLQASSTKS